MEDDFDEDEQFERDLEQVKSFFGKYLYEVCPRCRGEGKHVNPSIDSHGLSREDFDQDPDFEEDYFSGVYDVPCYVCSGARVVKAPNWLAFTCIWQTKRTTGRSCARSSSTRIATTTEETIE
jgi:hypothetical protein